MILVNAEITEEGSTNPVANTKIYLLSENIENIFKKVEADDPKRAMTLKLLSMVCAATEEQAGFNVDEYVSESIKPYIIEKATTDSNGKAEFHISQQENLYLFGMKKLRYGCAVWSKKIEKDEKNINLTRENAEMGLF